MAEDVADAEAALELLFFLLFLLCLLVVVVVGAEDAAGEAWLPPPWEPPPPPWEGPTPIGPVGPPPIESMKLLEPGGTGPPLLAPKLY